MAGTRSDKDIQAVLSKCLPVLDELIANHLSGNSTSTSVSIGKLRTLRILMTTRSKREALPPAKLEAALQFLEQLYEKSHLLLPKKKFKQEDRNKPSTSGARSSSAEKLVKTEPKTKKSYKTEIVVIIESSDEEEEISYVSPYNKDKNTATNKPTTYGSSNKLSDTNIQNRLENVKINSVPVVIEIEENDIENDTKLVKEKSIKKSIVEELEEGEICDDEDTENSSGDIQTKDCVVKENDNDKTLIKSASSITEHDASEEGVQNANNPVELSCNQTNVIKQSDELIQLRSRPSTSNSQVHEVIPSNTSIDKDPLCKENVGSEKEVPEVAEEVPSTVQINNDNQDDKTTKSVSSMTNDETNDQSTASCDHQTDDNKVSNKSQKPSSLQTNNVNQDDKTTKSVSGIENGETNDQSTASSDHQTVSNKSQVSSTLQTNNDDQGDKTTKSISSIENGETNDQSTASSDYPTVSNKSQVSSTLQTNSDNQDDKTTKSISSIENGETNDQSTASSDDQTVSNKSQVSSTLQTNNDNQDDKTTKSISSIENGETNDQSTASSDHPTVSNKSQVSSTLQTNHDNQDDKTTKSISSIENGKTNDQSTASSDDQTVSNKSQVSSTLQTNNDNQDDKTTKSISSIENGETNDQSTASSDHPTVSNKSQVSSTLQTNNDNQDDKTTKSISSIENGETNDQSTASSDHTTVLNKSQVSSTLQTNNDNQDDKTTKSVSSIENGETNDQSTASSDHPTVSNKSQVSSTLQTNNDNQDDKTTKSVSSIENGEASDQSTTSCDHQTVSNKSQVSSILQTNNDNQDDKTTKSISSIENGETNDQSTAPSGHQTVSNKSQVSSILQTNNDNQDDKTTKSISSIENGETNDQSTTSSDHQTDDNKVSNKSQEIIPLNQENDGITKETPKQSTQVTETHLVPLETENVIAIKNESQGLTFNELEQYQILRDIKKRSSISDQISLCSEILEGDEKLEIPDSPISYSGSHFDFSDIKIENEELNVQAESINEVQFDQKIQSYLNVKTETTTIQNDQNTVSCTDEILNATENERYNQHETSNINTEISNDSSLVSQDKNIEKTDSGCLNETTKADLHKASSIPDGKNLVSSCSNEDPFKIVEKSKEQESSAIESVIDDAKTKSSSNLDDNNDNAKPKQDNFQSTGKENVEEIKEQNLEKELTNACRDKNYDNKAEKADLKINKDKPTLLNNSQNIEPKDIDTQESRVIEQSDMPEPELKKCMDDTSSKDLIKDKTVNKSACQSVKDLLKHSSETCEIIGEIVKDSSDDNAGLTDVCETSVSADNRKMFEAVPQKKNDFNLTKESEFNIDKVSKSIETIKDNFEHKTDKQHQFEMFKDSPKTVINDLQMNDAIEAEINEEITTLKSAAIEKSSGEILKDDDTLCKKSSNEDEDVLKLPKSNIEKTNTENSLETEEILSIVVRKDLTKIAEKPALEKITAATVVNISNLKATDDKTNASTSSNKAPNNDQTIIVEATSNIVTETKEIGVDHNIASNVTTPVPCRDIARNILAKDNTNEITSPKKGGLSKVLKEYNDSNKNIDKSINKEKNTELIKEKKISNHTDISRQPAKDMNTIKKQNQNDKNELNTENSPIIESATKSSNKIAINFLPKINSWTTPIAEQNSNAKQTEESDFSDCLYLDLDENEKSFLEPTQSQTSKIDFTEPLSDEELKFDDNVKSEDVNQKNDKLLKSNENKEEITKREKRVSLSDISADEAPDKYSKLIDLIDISDESSVENISDTSDGIIESSFKKIHDLPSGSKNEQTFLVNSKERDNNKNITKNTPIKDSPSGKKLHTRNRDRHSLSPESNSNKSCVDRLPVTIPRPACEPLDPIRSRHDDGVSQNNWHLCRKDDTHDSSDSADSVIHRNIASYKKRLGKYNTKIKSKKLKKRAVDDDDTCDFLKQIDMAICEYDDNVRDEESDKEERKRRKSHKKKHSRSHKKKHKHRHRDAVNESDYLSNDNYQSDSSYSSKSHYKIDSHTKNTKKRLLSHSSNDDKSFDISNYKTATATNEDIIWGSSKHSLPKPKEPVTKATPIIELDDDDDDGYVIENTPLNESDKTSFIATGAEVVNTQIVEKTDNATKKHEGDKNEHMQKNSSCEVLETPDEHRVKPANDHQQTKIQTHQEEPYKNNSLEDMSKEIPSDDKPAHTTEETIITLDLTEDETTNMAVPCTLTEDETTNMTDKSLPELHEMLRKLEKQMGIKPLQDFITNAEIEQEQQQQDEEEDCNTVTRLHETSFQNSSINLPPLENSIVPSLQQIPIESQQYLNYNQFNNIPPYNQYARQVDTAQQALGYYNYPQHQMQLPRHPPTATIRANDPRLCSRLNLQAQKFRNSDQQIKPQSQIPTPSGIIDPRMESIIKDQIQSECLENISQIPGAHQPPLNIKQPHITKASITYGEYKRKRAAVDAEIKRRREEELEAKKKKEEDAAKARKALEIAAKKKEEDDAKSRKALEIAAKKKEEDDAKSRKALEIAAKKKEEDDAKSRRALQIAAKKKEEDDAKSRKALETAGKKKEHDVARSRITLETAATSKKKDKTKKEQLKVYNKAKSISPDKDKKSFKENSSSTSSESDTPIKTKSRKRRASRPLCLESDTSNDSTTLPTTRNVKIKSTPTPDKELTDNANVDLPKTENNTITLDRTQLQQALQDYLFSPNGGIQEKIISVLGKKVSSEKIERIKEVLKSTKTEELQDTSNISDVKCEVKNIEQAPSLSTSSKAAATETPVAATETPVAATISTIAGSKCTTVSKKKQGTKELEKLFRDIDGMYIRDEVINATGKRHSAAVAATKMATQQSGKRKHDNGNTSQSDSSDSDWEDNNKKIKRRKSCNMDLPPIKTKISQEDTKMKRGFAEEDDDTDDYSEHVREVLSKQNTTNDIWRCIPSNNKHPIVKLMRLPPNIEETVKLTSYIIDNNDELLKPLKVIDEPSTKKAKRTVKPKGKQLKNDNINYHTKSDDFDTCLICKKIFSNIVEHYVNSHTFSEVLCSRLHIDDIELLMKTPIKATKIPNTNKYTANCIFCKKEIKDTFVNFNEHYTTHTGEYAFECTACDVQKSSKKDILYHCKNTCKGKDTPKYIKLYTYKDEKQITAFACTRCNYIQLHQPHIMMHLKNEHLLKVVNPGDYREVILAEMPEEKEEESTEGNATDNIAVINEPVSVTSEEPEIILQFQTPASYIDSGLTTTKVEYNDVIETSINEIKTEQLLQELDAIFSDGLTVDDKSLVENPPMTVIHCPESINNAGNVMQDTIDPILQRQTQKVPISEIDIKETSFECTDMVEEKPSVSDIEKLQAKLSDENLVVNNTVSEDIKPNPTDLESATLPTIMPQPEECKLIKTEGEVKGVPLIKTNSETKLTNKEVLIKEDPDIINLDSDEDDCQLIDENEENVNEKITQKLAELINEKPDPVAADKMITDSPEKQDSDEEDYLVIELADDDNDEPLDLSKLQNDSDETLSATSNEQPDESNLVDKKEVKETESQESTAISRVMNIGYQKNANKIQYYCLVEQCQFLSTYDVKELQSHIREHTRTWSGKCNICKKRVYSETKIHLEHELHHLLEVHLKDELEGGQQNKQMKMSTDYLHVINHLKPWLCSTISNKSQGLCQEVRKPLQLYALYKCMGNDCSFATSSQSGFLHHLRKHDEKIRSYSSWTSTENPYNKPWLECCYCADICSDPDKLLKHINEVHSSSIFQCSKCFYRSCASYNVKIHQQIIHNVQSIKEIAIFICHGKTKTIKSEVSDILEHRDKNIKPLQCPGCEMKYFVKKDLMEHISEFHKSKINIKKLKLGIFACIYCDHETNVIQEIRQHMANKHPTRLLYVCARFLSTEKIHAQIDYSSVKSTSLMHIGELVEISLLKKCPFDISQLCITEASIQQLPNLQDDYINLTELYEPICDIYEAPSTSKQQSTETIENVVDFEQLKNCLEDDFGDTKDLKKDDRPGSKYEKELATELMKLIKLVVQNTGLSGKKLYICCIPSCKLSFKNFEAWKDHFLLKHPDTLNTSIYQCPHCGDIYQIQEFANHFISHETHRYFCYFCGETFLCCVTAEKHLQSKHSYINSRIINLLPEGHNKNYKDSLSQNKYYVITASALRGDIESLMKHMIDVLKLQYDNKKSQSTNTLCNINNIDDSSSSEAKELTNENYKQAKISLDDNDEENIPIFIKDSKRFICGYKHCMFRGRSETHLESHLREMHARSGGIYNCPHCNLQIKYSKFSSIRDHLRLHSGILFVCCNCSYVHCSRPELTRHLNVCHKDVDCVIINYTRAESVTKKQIEIVHSSTSSDIVSLNNDNIKCLSCPQRFSNYKELLKHATESHDVSVRYHCEYCKYRDQDRDYVIQHVITEHGNKIFRYRSVLHKVYGMEGLTVTSEVQIIEDDTIVINDDNNSNNTDEQPAQKYTFENGLYICNCGCQFRSDTEEDIKEHIKNNHDDFKMKDDTENTSTTIISKNSTITAQKPVLRCNKFKCLFVCDSETDLAEHISNNHEDECMPSTTSVPPEHAPSSNEMHENTPTASVSSASLQPSSTPSTSNEQLPIIPNFTIEMDSQNRPVINHNLNYIIPSSNTTTTGPTESSVESVQENPPKKQGIRLVPLTKLLKEDFLPTLKQDSISPPIQNSVITLIEPPNAQSIPSQTITDNNQLVQAVNYVQIPSTRRSSQYIESPQLLQQLTRRTPAELLSEVIFSCNQCNSSFPNMNELLNHFKTIHLNFEMRNLTFQYNVTRKLRCGYCDFINNFESIKTHHAQAHPNTILTTSTVNNIMQCSECTFICIEMHNELLSRNELFNHFATQHPDLLRKPSSSFNFFTQDLLDELLKLGQSSMSYKCRYCNNIYQDEALVLRHITESHQHFEILYEPYRESSLLYGCKQCNVLYNNEKPAVHHLRTHTKPYLCKFCSACFHDYTTLRSHYQQAHNKNEIGYRYISIRKYLFFYSDMLLVFPNGLVMKKSELRNTIYGKMEDFIKLIEIVDKEDLQKCAIGLGTGISLPPEN